MYRVDDLVYVYFGDLKASILYKNLNFNRFGKIIKIEEVGSEMYHYTIECKDHKLVLVKSYDSSFDICNMEELLNTIYISKANEKTKDMNIKIVDDILDFYK